MTSGQELASELIYDGKSIVAITPNTEIVAFSKAPGNIDDMAQYIFNKAGLFFIRLNEKMSHKHSHLLVIKLVLVNA